MNETALLQKMIDDSRRVVFFGGAGVSTESGIPDFRSTDGLYNQSYDYPPEEILSHTFFERRPEEFFRFYRDKMLVSGARPNAAHLKLAELEEAGKLTAVITQNIDGLHTDAGSKNVIELHGSVRRNYCVKCGKFYTAEYIKDSSGVPRCSCGGVVKPDVVLYEEQLDSENMRRALKYISECDMLIIGGTSLAVYPAAGMVQYYDKDRLVLINKTATPVDSYAALAIHDGIAKVMGKINVEYKSN